MSDELPWPRPGASIYTIKSGGPWCSLLKWAQGEHFGYTEGYLQAANLVYAHIAENRSGLDTLVFPLAYLWSHAIELELKRIIVEGGRLRGEKVKAPLNHKLAKLWVPAKEVIVSLYDHEPPGTDVVESILDELQALDPESTGFRFPETTKGKPNLAEPPERLDLPNFHGVMNDVYSFLTCANSEIAERLRWISEREAEMARDQ